MPLAHDGQLVAGGEGEVGVGSGDVFVTAADAEDEGSRAGAQARRRETPADGLGAGRQPHPLRAHLREAAQGWELLELERALDTQRLIVRWGDPVHEAIEVALRHLILGEDADEDLELRLEFLGDDDVLTESRDLRTLVDVDL